MKFSWENFRGALHLQHFSNAISYTKISKYSQENFCGALESHEKHESLAQRIFPRLR